MKKFIFFFACLTISAGSYSQDRPVKLQSLGIHFFFNDFQTATDIREKGLSNVIRENQFTKTDRMYAGLAASYLKGLHPNFDVAVTFSASFPKYTAKSTALNYRERFLGELAVAGHLKLLTDDFFFNPFVIAGVGASYYQSTFSAFLPLGGGLQFRLSPEVALQVQAQYRVPVTEKANYHLYYSAGIVAPLTDRPEPAPVVVVPPPVLDRDGDGINDVDDKCPDVAGLPVLQGCPDRDSDGITDGDDACPDVAGLAKYKGCPIPDSDGDGINDEEDKCPNVKGVARYQGCPIPDSDNDGVNDEEDKCPSRPGPATNQGCPEITKEVLEKINYAAKNVFFATGSYKLLPKSYKSLDEVVEILKSDDLLKIQIDGHTDAQGDDAKNLTLSENRAKAVRDYLIGKGVSEARLNSTGYGETRPVSDNKTAAGRAKNRRVEMTVSNY